MRFVKMLVRYLLVGGVLLTAATVLVMFTISYFQVAKVVRSAVSAKQMSKRPSHVSQCMLSATDTEYPLKGYQVRFLNDTDFVLEAVCTSAVKGPYEISKGSLLYGVKKDLGYSGVLFPSVATADGEASIGFHYGYARWVMTIGFQARTILTPSLILDREEVATSPGVWAAIATCEGWGYGCCNSLTQVGQGETITSGIQSCPGSCYTTCLERPSILIFTADPAPDVKSRVLRVRRGNLVVFSYGIQDVDSSGTTVTIDYGDGQTAISTNQTDEFSHVYDCQQEQCTFTASLSAIDTEGLENSRTRISTLTINVN